MSYSFSEPVQYEPEEDPETVVIEIDCPFCTIGCRACSELVEKLEQREGK